MFETLGKKELSFYLFVGLLILFSGIISIEMQYATAGQDGNQFDPFGQGGDSLGSENGEFGSSRTKL